MLSGFVESFWIGGTNIGNGQHFYWMGNNNSMQFTDWLKGRSENYPIHKRGQENCIEILTAKSLKWNRCSCMILNYFICEAL